MYNFDYKNQEDRLKYLIMDKNLFKYNIVNHMKDYLKKQHPNMFLNTYIEIILELKKVLDNEFGDI